MNSLIAPDVSWKKHISSRVSIAIDNVSVRYRSPVEPIRSIKAYAVQLLQNRIRMEDFWALKGVSLDIHRGETFALIGCNGAGKSTLLKVVSRVLSPSLGRVIIQGAVAPFLEFGAGFQPELTGHENIFLNGALLGHSRQEINKHLPDIFAFAGLEEFIDAPLRKYSSGMIARLGFAIATSWKPDILVLDEVLAVGDEAFTKKCLARINGFRASGSTVLLVTHNMNMVRAICDRAAWLEHGELKMVGSGVDVAGKYQASFS